MNVICKKSDKKLKDRKYCDPDIILSVNLK